MAETPNGTRPEHRVVVENLIGRELSPQEHVHHINRNPSDNRPVNLRVLTRSKHKMLHHAEDRLLRVLHNVMTARSQGGGHGFILGNNKEG